MIDSERDYQDWRWESGKRKDRIMDEKKSVAEWVNYIEFHLSGLNINKFEDLILLRDKKIQLDGLKNSGVCYQEPVFQEDVYYYGSGGIGQLYIKHVSFDTSLTKAEISGTFGFTFNDPQEMSNEVTYGRFDYRFRKSTNFYIK